jgi:hypothetical protein
MKMERTMVQINIPEGLCCDVTVAQINYPGKGTSKLIKLAKNIISKHLIVVVCVKERNKSESRLGLCGDATMFYI